MSSIFNNFDHNLETSITMEIQKIGDSNTDKVNNGINNKLNNKLNKKKYFLEAFRGIRKSNSRFIFVILFLCILLLGSYYYR